MKLVTIAGPPSSGKTSVILELIKSLREDGRTAGAVKFDCLTSFDQARYEEAGVPIQVGLAGKFCPDHFLATNIENCLAWGKEMGFDYFTTTLSISPYKNADWLNEIGQGLEKKYNVKYLVSDFKKKNGYKRSIELSKEYGLYRQDYCGCVFSKRQAESRLLEKELK